LTKETDRDEHCDLCYDITASQFLHARCHPTAPLRAIKEGDVLILRCYVPTCDREVVRLTLARPAMPRREQIKRRVARMEATHRKGE